MAAAVIGMARITGQLIDRREVGEVGTFDNHTSNSLKKHASVLQRWALNRRIAHRVLDRLMAGVCGYQRSRPTAPQKSVHFYMWLTEPQLPRNLVSGGTPEIESYSPHRGVGGSTPISILLRN